MTSCARSLLSLARQRLVAVGLSPAASRIDSTYLLSAALGDGSSLHVGESAVAANRALLPGEAALFWEGIDRRCKREPLQYILGDWDFDVLQKLKVRAPVLIPRPETEELVGLVSRWISDEEEGSSLPRRRILEVGSGSGAILLSLLRRHARIEGSGVDISPEAIRLALENRAVQLPPLEQHRLSLFEADIGHLTLGEDGNLPSGRSVQEAEFLARVSHAPFDCLVSNPPYIPNNEWEDEALSPLAPEVRKYEDMGALCGGAPYGAGMMLSMLKVVASGLLRPGAPLFLETHVLHPFLLAFLLHVPLPLPPLPHAEGAYTMLRNATDTHAADTDLSTAEITGSAAVSLPRSILALQNTTSSKRDEVWLADAMHLPGGRAALRELRDQYDQKYPLSTKLRWKGAFLDLSSLPRFVQLEMK